MKTGTDTKKAADIIKSGGLVVFPTETVYGLGADAFNENAVRKVFDAKRRPTDNPLIIHIADKSKIHSLAESVPENAERLIEKFWPGPLTIILKKKNSVPDIVTGGNDTVAIRLPDNEITLDLIRESETPIVGPSANISGKPSPTHHQHIIDSEIFEKVDYVLEGGQTEIGIESTVVDFTSEIPRIMRPGGLSIEEIESVIGKVEIASNIDEKIISPGMAYKHYAPNAEIKIIADDEYLTLKIMDELKNAKKHYKKIRIFLLSRNAEKFDEPEVIDIGMDEVQAAKNIFDLFLKADKDDINLILIQSFEKTGLGLGLMERIERASNK
ncbi:MAG TPA: L-threonylcarbamoyladenylate synthase [Candidatus Dojkabacteria bacterium]|jgi:L-threonylcarbamoyladenylate synthase